jgi:hypothetical protein
MLTGIRFCGKDEDDDPSEEFEEYMACTVCGDHGELEPESAFLLSANAPLRSS